MLPLSAAVAFLLQADQSPLRVVRARACPHSAQCCAVPSASLPGSALAAVTISMSRCCLSPSLPAPRPGGAHAAGRRGHLDGRQDPRRVRRRRARHHRHRLTTASCYSSACPTSDREPARGAARRGGGLRRPHEASASWREMWDSRSCVRCLHDGAVHCRGDGQQGGMKWFGSSPGQSVRRPPPKRGRRPDCVPAPYPHPQVAWVGHLRP